LEPNDETEQSVADLNPPSSAPAPQARAAMINANETLLRAIIDETSDAIYVKDTQGRYLLFNSAAEQITGKSADVALGNDDTFLFPPDEAQIVMEGDRRVMASGKIQTYEEVVTTAAGEQRTFLSTKGPLFDDQHRVVGLFGIARDITDRKRAENQWRHYADHLQAIHEIDRAILAARSTDEIARAATTRLRHVIPCERASVVLFDWGNLIARFVAVDSAEQIGPAEGAIIPLDEFSSRETLKQGPVRLIQDLAALEPRPPILERLFQMGIRSVMSAPFLVEGKLLGELNLASVQPNAFGETAQMMAREVAELLSIALAQAQLRNALERRATELEERVAERTRVLGRLYRQRLALSEIQLAINQPHELASVLVRVAEITAQLLPASFGASVILFDPDTDRFTLGATTLPGTAPQDLPARVRQQGGASRWIVEHREPVIVTDTRNDPFGEGRAIQPADYGAYVGVPLLLDDEIWGVLYALDQNPRVYANEDLELLNAIASRAAVAISKARLYQKLQDANIQLEHRRAELEAANQELEAFSYSISHDLRAPLRAINGFARILLDEHAPKLEPALQRYLRMIRDNAEQMGKLIDDLLAFSRLGRQPVRKEHVAVGDLVRRVMEELRAQENRQIEIVIGDLPDCQADPALLKQVWINLLSNAFKFTRKCAAPRVEIGALPIADFRLLIAAETDSATRDSQFALENMRLVRDSASIVYFVRDNGAGFDMKYAHKLFGVFQRLHSQEEYEGTGVGLAIVRRIVHRHGGEVWAVGAVNQGATFYFMVSP
jgi:PAS domain S-box-containing protein